MRARLLPKGAAVAFIYMLCLQGTSGADAPQVKGELSLENGTAHVWDCGRHQQITVFAMVATRFSELARQYKEASEDGKHKVLVEMRGTIRTSIGSGNGNRNQLLIIRNPEVVSVVRGACGSRQPVGT